MAWRRLPAHCSAHSTLCCGSRRRSATLSDRGCATLPSMCSACVALSMCGIGPWLRSYGSCAVMKLRGCQRGAEFDGGLEWPEVWWVKAKKMVGFVP